MTWLAMPADWMPAAKMQRIVCHWTGGTHKANSLDKSHYHVIVEGDGALVRGTHPISANEHPTPGKYAAHTLNCNTGSIGVSLACMGGSGVRENPFAAGKYPMTETQWTVMIEVCADLCARYGIEPGPKTLLSHAEVQANLGIAQRGKWDFTRLAFAPDVKGAAACGAKLRTEVAQALAGDAGPLPDPPAPAVDDDDRATDAHARMGTVTAGWLNLRRTAAGQIIGNMPRGTRVKVHGEHGDWLNVTTPFPVTGWAHRNYIDLD